MGTESDGLFRVGRNGRRVHYTAADTALPSDAIQSLLFDTEGTLWILDKDGGLTTYRSTQGFQLFSGLSSAVTTLSLVEGRLYAATASNQLYCLSPGEPQLLADLPFAVSSITVGDDAGIWLVGKEGISHLTPDGKLSEWESVPAEQDAQVLTFDFETAEGGAPITERKGFSWLYLLLAILVVSSLSPLVYFFYTRRKLNEVPAQPVAPAHPEVPSAPLIQSTAMPSHHAVKPEQPVKPVVPPTHAPAPTPAAPAPAIVSHKPAAPASAKPAVPAKPAPQIVSGPSFYQQVSEIIKANYTRADFSVEEIAAELGLSRIHVNRKLKAEAGTSPSTMLKDVRMKKAAQLLKEGKTSVSEIAAACGFSTPSYFSTAFREYYEKTPSEFLAASESE